MLLVNDQCCRLDRWWGLGLCISWDPTLRSNSRIDG